MTAYRSLASGVGSGAFGAWLTRIGVRIALRQAGKRRTVAWRDPGQSVAGIDDRPDPADRAADRAAMAAAPFTDPALLSLRAERATEIRTAVTGLPEPYREVVALRFFGESSLEEIATQTGRPLATVKTQLYRGLARLRDQVEGTDRSATSDVGSTHPSWTPSPTATRSSSSRSPATSRRTPRPDGPRRPPNSRIG